MKKFLIGIALILLLGFPAQYFLPWWSIAMVTFVLGFALRLRPSGSYVCGFLGTFLLWGGYAFVIDYLNNSLMASRISQIFGLPNSLLLVLVTGLVGGIVGGLAMTAGSYGSRLSISSKKF